MSNIPFQRDYLKEAYKILKGEDIKVKREHVIAAMGALVEFQSNTQKIRDLMNQAYEEACKLRKEKGLPIPPRPPLPEEYKDERNE